MANAGINHHSVFRRSTLVLALFISGLFLGYVLLITANKLLSAEAFGLYYLAWTLINILSTPVVVMSFTTTFAKLHASDGKAGVAIGFRGVERWLLQWNRIYRHHDSCPSYRFNRNLGRIHPSSISGHGGFA